VLIVAGSHDRHTTLEESEDLFEEAVAPKAMWVLNGAFHEDFLLADPAGYETHVLGFLENHLRAA
jgi:alpha-beta hydrolase superfamily lysophospholipase